MLQLTINTEGSLYFDQWCVAPTIYLDHWAWRKISEDKTLATRFSKALKVRNGTVAISWLNLAEFSKVTDERQTSAADALLNDILPDVFVITPDLFKVIEAENELMAGNQPNAPHADLNTVPLFLELLDRNSQKPLSPRNLFQLVPRTEIAQSFDSFADVVIQWVSSTRQEYNQSKEFRGRVERLPNGKHVQCGTRFIASELVGSLLKESDAPFNRHDAIDLCHAVVSVAYCDYVLLDRRWTVMVERAQKRIRDGGLFFPMAKAISEKNNGLERFLQELESGPTAEVR